MGGISTRQGCLMHPRLIPRVVGGNYISLDLVPCAMVGWGPHNNISLRAYSPLSV